MDQTRCSTYDSEMTAYLRNDDVVEVTEEAGLLCKDVVRRCEISDSQSSGQRRVGTEGQGEVVLPQEREEGGGLTGEELQSHWSTWRQGGSDTDVRLFLCCAAAAR